MDLWQEVSPGTGVWYISREVYLSVCICVANRSSNCVVVGLRRTGHPSLSNVVILAPITVKYTENKNTDKSIDNKMENSSEMGINVSRVIHPQSTVVLITVSPADDSMPMTLDFQLDLLDTVHQPLKEKNNIIPFDKAVAQSRVVEEWLQQEEQQQQQEQSTSH
ncbi:hypothetical protein LSM04_005253 [Trypanosoma melophagium]|uniref:uncharacterized protein n=1 Tax=Trypanosoma melophagium TaxID=715481 RepID=UPI00351A2253|nr:hypothetical protein LSM04_005253 [Trypanosoma melophagium]